MTDLERKSVILLRMFRFLKLAGIGLILRGGLNEETYYS